MTAWDVPLHCPGWIAATLGAMPWAELDPEGSSLLLKVCLTQWPTLDICPAGSKPSPGCEVPAQAPPGGHGTVGCNKTPVSRLLHTGRIYMRAFTAE